LALAGTSDERLLFVDATPAAASCLLRGSNPRIDSLLEGDAAQLTTAEFVVIMVLEAVVVLKEHVPVTDAAVATRTRLLLPLRDGKHGELVTEEEEAMETAACTGDEAIGAWRGDVSRVTMPRFGRR
jgi:hypothetical protein